jgi:type II secretory pathway pseudopilin PulG
MRILVVAVIAAGLALIILGLVLYFRARLARARERQRVARGEPVVIDGQARVVEKEKPGRPGGGDDARSPPG